MLERYDPEHSWRILSLRRRVERSSLVERFGSIREVGELGSKADMLTKFYRIPMSFDCSCWRGRDQSLLCLPASHS